MGRPEEVADVAVYLPADEPVFVTGSGVVTDGGLTARWGSALAPDDRILIVVKTLS